MTAKSGYWFQKASIVLFFILFVTISFYMTITAILWEILVNNGQKSITLNLFINTF
jgi:hypothetical protein